MHVPCTDVADLGQKGEDGIAQVGCGQVVWLAGGGEGEQLVTQRSGRNVSRTPSLAHPWKKVLKSIIPVARLRTEPCTCARTRR